MKKKILYKQLIKYQCADKIVCVLIMLNMLVLIDVFSVSYCMVCTYLRAGNPQALASGLSLVHRHNHTVTALLHQHACVPCAL